MDITSGNGSYTAQSNNASVATATISNNTIVVSGVSAGTATITVTDTQSNQSASIAVTVTGSSQPSYSLCPDDHHPHMIDLGLPSGTKWACCNVGATAPEGYGGYYAWGETETKSIYDRSTYKYYKNGGYVSLGSNVAGTQYDVAHVKWGGTWQMPSKEQREELINNCTYEWTTENGVNGCRFTSKKNGASIFLPAAGAYSGDRLYGVGIYGDYRSSTKDPDSSHDAYYLIRFENRAIVLR